MKLCRQTIVNIFVNQVSIELYTAALHVCTCVCAGQYAFLWPLLGVIVEIIILIIIIGTYEYFRGKKRRREEMEEREEQMYVLVHTLLCSKKINVSESRATTGKIIDVLLSCSANEHSSDGSRPGKKVN